MNMGNVFYEILILMSIIFILITTFNLIFSYKIFKQKKIIFLFDGFILFLLIYIFFINMIDSKTNFFTSRIIIGNMDIIYPGIYHNYIFSIFILLILISIFFFLRKKKRFLNSLKSFLLWIGWFISIKLIIFFYTFYKLFHI